MSAPRGLTTVALLKTRLDEGKDHLGLYEPLIDDAIIHLGTQDFGASDVKATLQARSGIVLPLDPIQTLLGRVQRRGHLTRQGGRFFVTSQPIPDPRLDTARAKVEAEQLALGKALQDYCAADEAIFDSAEKALEGLAGFVSDNKLSLVLDESAPRPIPERPPEERKIGRAIARFITESCSNSGELRASLQRLTEGIVLHDALLLVEIPKATERFRDLQVFFDTPVLFALLELHGVASAIAAKESLTLLRESGATTLAFRRTLDEVRSILAVYEQHLATSEGRLRLRPTPLAHHVLTSKMSSADIRLISATLDSRLTKLGIALREYPQHDPRYTADEAALEKALADANHSDDVTARVRHDVDSIAAILTLRRARTSTSIERCGAAFCTSSGRVVRNVQKWFAAQGDQGVPPIVHQVALTSIAWLKRPAAVPDLKMHELAVLCAAALRPSRATWSKFIDVLRKLKSDGTITDDETAAIVASELTEPMLAHLDDELEPDASSISEAIERVRDDYRRKAAASAEEAVRVAKADASVAQQAASDALSRAEAIQRKVEGRIRRAAQVVAKACFWVVLLITVVSAILSLPDVFEGVGGKVKTAARIVLGLAAVFGVVSTVSGTTLNDLRSGVETWVFERLASWWLPGPDDGSEVR